MNSINRNQPEHNHTDLQGHEAISKIQQLVSKAQNCFFRTLGGESELAVRPMNVRLVDDDGVLWFLSASDSHQNRELAKQSAVTLYFQGSPHSDFLLLTGEAEVTTDKMMIEKLWEPVLKTWFTGGIEDPRITVIKFTPAAGYYWDTKHGTMVAGVKMVIGTVLGTTLDDSIEGALKV